MITKLKNDGASSTAGAVSKRGHKGRLELFGERIDDNEFTVNFADFGGFGKLRWHAQFGKLDASDLRDMIQSLQDLLHGTIDSTALDSETLEGMLADAIAEAKSQSNETEAEPVIEEIAADDEAVASTEEAMGELVDATEELAMGDDSVDNVNDLSC
jgi:hypothetical protein